MRNEKVMLWDVDTQVDFMSPKGKLYVPGSEEIVPQIELQQKRAQREGYTRAGSVDAHSPEDAEFKLFPEHCVYGTPGQKKISQTASSETLYVPMQRLLHKQIEELIQYPGPVIFEKNTPNCAVNPNIRPYLELIQPEKIVAYGLVTEICLDRAVIYLAGDLGYKVEVIESAIKELDKSNAEKCMQNWKAIGACLA